MTKIQKVDLNLGHNPFKTKRNSSTNPFKYQDFEGNTIDPLVCADVLVSFKGNAQPNKLKLISSSVMGSITKLHNSITEPIVNFVKRIGTGISNAWDYAKNTNVSEVAGIRDINKALNTDILDIGKGIGNSISGLGRGIADKMSFLNTDIADIGKGISNKMSFLNTDVTELSKGISEKWSSLIGNIHHNKITKDTSVNELRTMWEEQIALSTKEAA